MTPATLVAPHDLADTAVREVLRTQWDGVPAVRLDSPPGAGKTGVVERLAAQALGMHGERCMVVTQTNEQVFDVARRIANGFRRLPVHLFLRNGLALPEDLAARSNLIAVRSGRDLPAGPCIVIANAAKWSWIKGEPSPFDLQVVDEAFQLPDHRFQQIAGLARRVVLVGDPGQIAPVITCEIERWKADPAGPHVACPRALVVRHPWVRRMALPVSRRLVPDTVRIVQPAFYPDLPFVALSAAGERGLVTNTPGLSLIDEPISLVERGASIVQLELPPAITGPVDEESASAIVDLVVRLLQRGTHVRDGLTELPLTPAMIGIVCAHVAQVNAVRERLPAALTEVLVETADRFQGLERAVMFVHHPLSGRADASEFHLDAGRFCVMLSRHRVGCFIVARGGVEELLLRYAPSGARILGLDDDPEFAGWQAHLCVIEQLRRLGRVFRLSDAESGG